MSEIPCPIYQHAVQNSDAPALVWSGGLLTYRAFDTAIDNVQQRLKRGGVEKGQRIGIILHNNWQYVILLQALFRLRAVAIPLSTRFPESTIQSLAKDLEFRLIVKDEQSLSFIQTISIDRLFDEDDVQSEQADSPAYDDAQEATVLFSSGSTGLPKAILHHWRNHYYSALGSNQNITLGRGDRWLLSLPLYHVAGIAILFRCFVAGAAVVIADAKMSLQEGMRTFAVTHVSMVSTQLLRLLDDIEQIKLLNLKAILLGGSAMSRGLIETAYRAGLPIHTSYGMTELASQVATTRSGAKLDELLTSGSVLPHREIKFDANNQILVRGKTRFAGYLEPSSLSKPFDTEGWFETGDIGVVDTQGRLVVTGRLDNMFISGGENIHPEEIERALESYPDVARAIVVDVPEAEFGARPVAFLKVGGEMPAKEALENHLVGRIPRFMNPVRYLLLEEERAIHGIKISRQALRARAMQDHGIG